MSNYGVTDKGFVRKRYDTIYAEMQEDIKNSTGVDVAQNPKSFLNVLLSSVGDKLAKLWEVAESVYLNHYPASAEGINLDNACQFGGITREGDSRTKYTILCTGKDGTTIQTGTRIASKTNPKIYFATFSDYEISRQVFNKARIMVVSAQSGKSYTVKLDDEAYTYVSGAADTVQTIIEGLKNSITDDGYNVSKDGDVLAIEAKNKYINYRLALSDNLTTDTVSTLITFQSEEYGEFALPDDSITEIITTLTGFKSCTNLGTPIYGRLRETDVEFRQSYINKRSSRSSSMLESIAGAVMTNVEGVISVSVYENDTNVTDEYGRPPHSIETVVDGGGELEIAQQIFKAKAAGIQTCGLVVVDVPGLYNDTVKVRFNRPTPVYVWLKVTYTKSPVEPLPPNAEDLIKETIMGCVEGVKSGDTVVLQKFITPINNAVTGIAYMDIKGYTADSDSSAPSEDDYTLNYISTASREKAVFNIGRIEVVQNE